MDAFQQFQEMLKEAIRCQASDVHLKSNSNPLFRIRGELTRPEQPVFSYEDIEFITRSLGVTDDAFTQKGNVDTSYHNLGSRFRINISRVYTPHNGNRNGLQISARILPDTPMVIDDIGFPNDCYKEILSLERGLVLVTGVTGSGKSTTLASIIDTINKTQKKKIITLEQPVEYFFQDDLSYITQREVPSSVVSFADGIREAMRQDPDLIMIGEIRDYETVDAALQAVESGHLVLSTIHATNAYATVQRMASLVPEEMMLKIRHEMSVCLEFVLSQQLLPRYKKPGRVLAMEVFRPGKDPAPRKYIRDALESRIPDYMVSHKDSGNILMDECLLHLQQRNDITAEIALQYAHNREQLKQKLKGQGID